MIAQGWRDEPVRVVEYDPEWPARFEAERVLLEPVLGAHAPGGIHHVGSTAVPGLAAKPVIDILVGVVDLAAGRCLIPALAALEYLHAPYREDEMVWFCKPHPARRTHHLHLVPDGSQRYEDELRFRNLLRADPGLAAEYVALKHDLARTHADDRDAYTSGKSAFVQASLRG